MIERDRPGYASRRQVTERDVRGRSDVEPSQRIQIRHLCPLVLKPEHGAVGAPVKPADAVDMDAGEDLAGIAEAEWAARGVIVCNLAGAASVLKRKSKGAEDVP